MTTLIQVLDSRTNIQGTAIISRDDYEIIEQPDHPAGQLGVRRAPLPQALVFPAVGIGKIAWAIGGLDRGDPRSSEDLSP